MPDLSGLMGQMQAMMAPYDGPVNWTLATDIARRTSAQEPDPSPDGNDQTRVADAIRLADHWLDDATVLVVDDVADTGRTLELVHRFCAGHVRQVRTAVLYAKPHSVIECDYVWRRTDRWINFPWSTQPPVAPAT